MQLSPEVEVWRKGKGKGIGRKRERCVSYWDEDILGRGTGGTCAGEEVGEGEREEGKGKRKGGLEMVEMRNGKVVLMERVVEVDVIEDGEGEGKGERGVGGDVDEEGERGRERRLEFMVGMRGRGFD